MTSDEKAAGKRPSATDSSPCPPAWLTRASVRSTPQPDAAFGISRGSNAPGDAEEHRGRDQAEFEGHARRPAATARGPDREEVEPEEDARHESEAVAEDMAGVEGETLGHQCGAAEDAEPEPDQHRSAHGLAQEQPTEEHHPDRRRGGEEGRIGDGRVHDGEMPEEKVAGEAQTRQHRRRA